MSLSLSYSDLLSLAEQKLSILEKLGLPVYPETVRLMEPDLATLGAVLILAEVALNHWPIICAFRPIVFSISVSGKAKIEFAEPYKLEIESIGHEEGSPAYRLGVWVKDKQLISKIVKLLKELGRTDLASSLRRFREFLVATKYIETLPTYRSYLLYIPVTNRGIRTLESIELTRELEEVLFQKPYIMLLRMVEPTFRESAEKTINLLREVLNSK